MIYFISHLDPSLGEFKNTILEIQPLHFINFHYNPSTEIKKKKTRATGPSFPKLCINQIHTQIIVTNRLPASSAKCDTQHPFTHSHHTSSGLQLMTAKIPRHKNRSDLKSCWVLQTHHSTKMVFVSLNSNLNLEWPRCLDAFGQNKPTYCMYSGRSTSMAF